MSFPHTIMFYKVVVVFFVVIVVLFGCLIFTVHDRKHRPILCSKLVSKWTCQREVDCAARRELIRDHEYHHCGIDGFDSRICCPPNKTHYDSDYDWGMTEEIQHTHSNPVSIVQQKCREYAEYRFINETVDSQLPDGQEPIQRRILECISIEPMVVGGVDAKALEFPHMALLGFGDSVEDAKYMCGGTLISEQFILTAAHCTHTSDQANGSWAILGSLSRFDAKSEKLGQNVFRIVEHINHPDYSEVGRRNDIALYRLEYPLQLTPHIRPTCLDTMDLDKTLASAQVEASVAGWGSIGPGDPQSDFLMKASVRIHSHEACEVDLLYHSSFDAETMICAGNPERMQDTCFGDSGGPLQTPKDDMDCMWNQIGITARGHIICGSGPAIYSKVAHYIPWIQKIVWP